MKFKTFLFTVLIGVSVELSADEIPSLEFAQVQLAGIWYDLKLFEIQKTNCTGSEDYALLLAKSLTRKLITVSLIDPEIDELDGSSLEVLCELSNNRELLKPDKVFGSDRIQKYLDSIEEAVSSQIASLQKSMKGKGCSITP